MSEQMMTATPVFNHQTRKVGELVQRRIDALGIGQKMQDLPEELWHDSFRYYVKEDPNRRGGPNLRMIRLDPDQPSLTVTGYIFNKFVHPFEHRFITPREAARLQGFPDDFEFKGTLTSVQQQVGDAVPIELGETLFRTLLEFISRQYPTKTAFSAVGLFSGAGGLELAAHKVHDEQGHHWKTLASVEIAADRCETLRNYFGPELTVIQKDITQLDSQEILENATGSPIHLVYGGPPCQSFSQAGKQKGAIDPRGTLIFEFLRMVEEIRPPLFVMENVPNLKAIDKGKLLQATLAKMDSLGYKVDYGVLNSAQYGNAQKRQRLIFFGTHATVEGMVCLPTPTHVEQPDLFGSPRFKTVREALTGLPAIDMT